MTTYYNVNPQFYVSVDCIIFGFDKGSLKLLLLKRNFEPAKGQWSLMGGFVQKNESVDEAAQRVLKELTGLENVYMEQVGTYGEIHRDPGERVISVAYSALININPTATAYSGLATSSLKPPTPIGTPILTANPTCSLA